MRGFRVRMESADKAVQRGMNEKQLAEFLRELADEIDKGNDNIKILNIEQPDQD